MPIGNQIFFQYPATDNMIAGIIFAHYLILSIGIIGNAFYSETVSRMNNGLRKIHNIVAGLTLTMVHLINNRHFSTNFKIGQKNKHIIAFNLMALTGQTSNVDACVKIAGVLFLCTATMYVGYVVFVTPLVSGLLGTTGAATTSIALDNSSINLTNTTSDVISAATNSTILPVISEIATTVPEAGAVVSGLVGAAQVVTELIATDTGAVNSVVTNAVSSIAGNTINSVGIPVVVVPAEQLQAMFTDLCNLYAQRTMDFMFERAAALNLPPEAVTFTAEYMTEVGHCVAHHYAELAQYENFLHVVFE